MKIQPTGPLLLRNLTNRSLTCRTDLFNFFV